MNKEKVMIVVLSLCLVISITANIVFLLPQDKGFEIPTIIVVREAYNGTVFRTATYTVDSNGIIGLTHQWTFYKTIRDYVYNYNSPYFMGLYNKTKEESGAVWYTVDYITIDEWNDYWSKQYDGGD